MGEGGLLSTGPKNVTIIVMSTLDPDTMNELGEQVEENGYAKLIAAAVSGGATGAEAGTLSIMASGAEDVVTAARPYFDAVGSNSLAVAGLAAVVEGAGQIALNAPEPALPL